MAELERNSVGSLLSATFDVRWQKNIIQVWPCLSAVGACEDDGGWAIANRSGVGSPSREGYPVFKQIIGPVIVGLVVGVIDHEGEGDGIEADVSDRPKDGGWQDTTGRSDKGKVHKSLRPPTTKEKVTG